MELGLFNVSIGLHLKVLVIVRLLEKILVMNFMKLMLKNILLVFLIFYSFLSSSTAQLNTSMSSSYENYDEYLKTAEKHLTHTNAFEPVVYVEQIRQFGISPIVENEAAFLNLSPIQKDEFVEYIKQMAQVAATLKSSYRTVRFIKKQADIEKYQENLKLLDEEWAQIPQKLLEIFGPAKYRRFLDFILFKRSCSFCDPNNVTVFKNSFFYNKIEVTCPHLLHH